MTRDKRTMVARAASKRRFAERMETLRAIASVAPELRSRDDHGFARAAASALTRVLGPMSHREIAEAVGLSKARIEQIEARAFRKLREALEAE